MGSLDPTRVYLTDPLICPDCSGELRVIAFITDDGRLAYREGGASRFSSSSQFVVT